MHDMMLEKEVLVNFAWVTRPERPKGAKDEVKRLEGPPARSRGPEGPSTSSSFIFNLEIYSEGEAKLKSDCIWELLWLWRSVKNHFLAQITFLQEYFSNVQTSDMSHFEE